MKEETYLDAKQASELTGIPKYTLYYLAKLGRCPAVKVPGTRSIKFPKIALLEWIESGRMDKADSR